MTGGQVSPGGQIHWLRSTKGVSVASAAASSGLEPRPLRPLPSAGKSHAE